MSWPGNDTELAIENELVALRATDTAARNLLLELNRRVPPTPECAEWMIKVGIALAAWPGPST